MSDKPYDGVVVFVQGVHYAVDKDGNPDHSRPLRWDNGAYRPAIDGEPIHNDVHFAQDAELPVGGDN